VPDHEAVVEVVAAGRTFKIAGSEAFIEKMLGMLPTAFPARSAADQESQTNEREESEKDGSSGRSHETIDDFVARLGITNATPEIRKVSAFVFFLTEIVKSPTCSSAQIEECFDVTGLKTPENLPSIINNAGKAKLGGYIRSVTRGAYGVTTNGKNLVKEMARS
jgi:hypothetical protein